MPEDINKAEKLSKLYYANLLRKLNEGKSLSDKEFKHLQALAAAPSSPPSAKSGKPECFIVLTRWQIVTSPPSFFLL